MIASPASAVESCHMGLSKKAIYLLVADLQLYIDGHSRRTSTADQQQVIVRWANVLQWFSVRASWVHSIEIRNFSQDFAEQHDCPPGGPFVLARSPSTS